MYIHTFGYFPASFYPFLGPIFINPRPAGGGGGRLNAPLRFFEDSENTAARIAAGFSPTLTPSFSQLL